MAPPNERERKWAQSNEEAGEKNEERKSSPTTGRQDRKQQAVEAK